MKIEKNLQFVFNMELTPEPMNEDAKKVPLTFTVIAPSEKEGVEMVIGMLTQAVGQMEIHKMSL